MNPAEMESNPCKPCKSINPPGKPHDVAPGCAAGRRPWLGYGRGNRSGLTAGAYTGWTGLLYLVLYGVRRPHTFPFGGPSRLPVGLLAERLHLVQPFPQRRLLQQGAIPRRRLEVLVPHQRLDARQVDALPHQLDAVGRPPLVQPDGGWVHSRTPGNRGRHGNRGGFVPPAFPTNGSRRGPGGGGRNPANACPRAGR